MPLASTAQVESHACLSAGDLQGLWLEFSSESTSPPRPPALPGPAGFRMGWRSAREEERLSWAPCCCPPTIVHSRHPRRLRVKLN